MFLSFGYFSGASLSIAWVPHWLLPRKRNMCWLLVCDGDFIYVFAPLSSHYWDISLNLLQWNAEGFFFRHSFSKKKERKKEKNICQHCSLQLSYLFLCMQFKLCNIWDWFLRSLEFGDLVSVLPLKDFLEDNRLIKECLASWNKPHFFLVDYWQQSYGMIHHTVLSFFAYNDKHTFKLYL